MDEVVTHDADELVAVDLVPIPVLFAFSFIADLLVHILFPDHGGGKYDRPGILLEGVLRFFCEVIQLESVLQQIVGVFYSLVC